VSREPEDIDLPGHSAFGARRLLRGLVRRQHAGTGRAAVVRWMGQLVLLDSWSPASHRLGSPQAARTQALAEWARSGDLTEAQARSLLVLDEATPWQV